MSTNFLPISANTSVGRYISLLGMRTEQARSEDLADFVRRSRSERRLSQRDVELKSGGEISKGYIGQIENRTVLGHSVTPQKLQALARGLGVSEEEIFAIARGKAASGDLTLEELRILEGFRALNEERREIALNIMSALGESKYRSAIVAGEKADFKSSPALKPGARKQEPSSARRTSKGSKGNAS